MDKNKSAYKLKVWVLSTVSIWMTRLNGGSTWRTSSNTGRLTTTLVCLLYDGREDDLGHILKGTYPEQMSGGEIGCTTSHLKAIKQFYESGEPYHHDGRRL